jgi:1-acyl-sn-glycerol-3-phosphate acyltransferase
MVPGLRHTVPMLLALPRPLRVVVIAATIALNTLVHFITLMAAALAKALAPAPARLRWSERLARIAESWIGVNSALIRHGTRTRFAIELPVGLRRDASYLVLANHQSWVDIPVLQHVFNRRLPLLRFFLKQELVWVPLLGIAWWALDFPFMRRYSKEQLARRPERAGSDIDATRRACEKFRAVPVAVMNFVEGTRFTVEKHAQGSPHRHLLRPKAGGVAFVLDAMGGLLEGVLDVTLVYPGGRPTLWQLACNRIPTVRLHARLLPVPAEAVGADYESDPEFRAWFQAWINGLWAEKDARIEAMLPANGDCGGGSPSSS